MTQSNTPFFLQGSDCAIVTRTEDRGWIQDYFLTCYIYFRVKGPSASFRRGYKSFSFSFSSPLGQTAASGNVSSVTLENVCLLDPLRILVKNVIMH